MCSRRFALIVGLPFVAFSIVGCTKSSTAPEDTPQWVEVDFAQFPDGGLVANRTVLSDQWASVGILFGAEPAGVTAVKEDFGGNTAHLFFSPDVFGAVAVFRFVDPETGGTVDASAFRLAPWFNPGESAQLVGIDAAGVEVVFDTVTPDDIGNESLNVEMPIEGTFRVVEWRTEGNPGIAVAELAFKF